MHRRHLNKRAAYTLLELVLALALIVMATAMIGSLMQMFARNFVTRGEDIRRQQLARAVLSMMAEDIRAVVLEQEYDGAVLEQQLGTGGAAAGQGGDPAAGGGGLASESTSVGETSDVSAEGEGDLAETASTSYPPGVYGDQFTLIVDVSRLPRPDEYIVQQTSLVDGNLNDIPGDIKTVTYYVQAATNQGVSDEMDAFSANSETTGYSGGLVRRALDRAVTAYAEQNGDTSRLSRTGDLVAPEVIAVEFSYFDGTEWLLEWDSSEQSLPWLIQISLAMQSATGSEKAQLEPGTQISSMTITDREMYGVEVYELVVAIPGANLVAASAAEADAAGMEGLGL